MATERGTVRWFDEEKNYGFIDPDVGEKDVFFHRSDLDTLERTIMPGDRVEYESEKGPKGMEAKHVRVFEE